MFLSPISDGSIGVLLLFSLVAGLISLIIVVLVETFVLWFLQWGSFLRSLGVSIIGNLISTFVGVFLYLVSPWKPVIFEEDGFAPSMFILWAISVIIESVVLYIFCKKPHTRTLVISAIINACSYFPLCLWLMNTLFN